MHRQPLALFYLLDDPGVFLPERDFENMTLPPARTSRNGAGGAKVLTPHGGVGISSLSGSGSAVSPSSIFLNAGWVTR